MNRHLLLADQQSKDLPKKEQRDVPGDEERKI